MLSGTWPLSCSLRGRSRNPNQHCQRADGRANFLATDES
jgi:hypothetical protein